MLPESGIESGAWTKFLAIFTSIFVAELGDKTQVSALLFASDQHASKVMVFLATASALMLSSALAIALGGFVSTLASPRTITTVAGVLFVVIGAWTIWSAQRG